MGITLKEAFEKKSISALKEVASAMHVKGYTKMSRDELTDACVNAVNRKAVTEELSYLIPDSVWELFQKTAKSENGIKFRKPHYYYAALERIGLLYSEKYGNEILLIVPDEIKVHYDELVKDGFLDVKRVADLIHNYAQAAVNLYGAITQDELVDIINSQNGNISDTDLNFQIFLRHIAFDADYVLWEEYIVHEDFEEDDFEGVKSLLGAAGSKPRYIPEKSEFLKYSDWMYYEQNAQIAALSEFLQNKCGVHDSDIDGIMLDLHWAFANEDSVSKDFEIFELYNIVFEESQINELVGLLMNCRNNTRLWENKGYTPNELVRIYKQVKPKIQKIGRNDPCPCGSGKKYKKCCGK